MSRAMTKFVISPRALADLAGSAG